MDITNTADEVNLTAGEKVYLKGILQQTLPVNPGTCYFPTISSDLKPVVNGKTKGKGLYCKTVISKVLSLSGLLRAQFKVHFETGIPGDPQYGGTITEPDWDLALTLNDAGEGTGG